MIDKKKQTVAVSAVLAYLQKEAEERDRVLIPAAVAETVPNVWGLSGRQAQMQLRNLMQLKAFHPFRLR